MADREYPKTLYVQMSDCGQHIRKWSREPFEGCCDYSLARDRRCWEYPLKGASIASCGHTLAPAERGGELVTYWGWDNGTLCEHSGCYCTWCAINIKVSGLHIDTWVYEEEPSLSLADHANA